ncbi:winged helix-turn-helix domain-containing protein [Ochrobactrum soli]|uniref:winged helix-turn-helix domain-containing protein n=1 Tax=Ochrobactrum soli TaxID=2448455 RepID=UPI0015E8103C|nr:winged helix-turn-helix domain-containing protein [[Ochrobactrum] soli]
MTISKHIDKLDKVTTLSFEGFELDVVRRKLTYLGTPVTIGSRAFDILSALAQRPGNVVAKGDIISSVWPDTHVDEGALRVHLTALRKALRAHCTKEFVVNIAGRGYLLTAEISCAQTTEKAQGFSTRLPWLPFELLGREELLHRWTGEDQARGTTIVGAAGTGKSSMAISLARAKSDNFDAVFYVALTCETVSVVSEIASSMGLRDHVRDASEICSILSSRKVLLVLDGCFGDRDNVAAVIEELLLWTPGLHVIATALEPLGFRGERIKVLRGLATPPTSTREQILASPAVSLFISAAGGFDDRAFQSDKVLELVADIVRALAGNPAAIESTARALHASTIEDIYKIVIGHPASQPTAHNRETSVRSPLPFLSTDAKLEPRLWFPSFRRRSLRPSPVDQPELPQQKINEPPLVERSGHHIEKSAIASEASYSVAMLRSGRPPPIGALRAE